MDHERSDVGICAMSDLAEVLKRSNGTLRVFGPCPTCGHRFESRDRKIFCSMVCYHRSDRFKEIVAERATRQTIPDPRSCVYCGATFTTKPSSKRKYCSKICQRRWFAERHDRWVANPQKIALPQAYDEFLSHNELSCIVEGCDWTGQNLSIHVNHVHGISADEFKELAGFNRHSGLVSAELSQTLRDRPYAHLRDNPEETASSLEKMREIAASKNIDKPKGGSRLEHREHSRKQLAERRAAASAVSYKCARCSSLFVKFGLKRNLKYCNTCKADAHYERAIAARFVLKCSRCGAEFRGNRLQRLRMEKGLNIFCMCCRTITRKQQLVEIRRRIQIRGKPNHEE